MQLRELELSGFKSFAQPTRLVFRAGIAAVIGPNGSGKSNVAEAIRWVLGEQSLKALRGRSSEDVIFAGNDTVPRKGQATVSLTLDNESTRLGVDAPEVTITRSINRAGESEYLINGDLVRLVDIQHLLAAAGLGARTYAVISQGMVDQYLTTTPAGRRELFDEATGVKALQIKLKQAQSKLQQAMVREQELAAVVAELEPRLRVLARQVQRHEERIAVAADYAEKQRTWYHQAWYELVGRMERLREEVAQQQAAVTAARQAREQVEAQLLNAASGATVDTAATKRAQLQHELLAAQHEFERAQAAYEQARQERENLATSLASVQAARREAEQKLLQARSRAGQDDFFTHLRELLGACREVLAAVQQNASLDQAALAQLDQQLAAADAELAREDSTVAAAQSLLEQLEGPLQAVARLQAIEEERHQRLQQLGEPQAPSRSRIEQLEQRLSVVQESHQTDEIRTTREQGLAAVRGAELEAERSHSAAQAALEQAQRELAELESAIKRECGSQFLQDIQHTPPSTAVISLDEVQQLAGRLASLGEIDPLALKEYEEVTVRFERLQGQLTDAQETRANTERLARQLGRDIERQFREQFQMINKAFGHYFEQLFEGGSARLELIDSPSTELRASETSEASETSIVVGVEIMVNPPGKKPSHVHLLSGGEKALTSLALVLAIMQVQKPPFLVLDEVDAALDEANSHRFAQLLHHLKAHTQVVIITHNRETMSEADILYGITMHQDGVSHVYSVKMDEIPETEEMAV